MVKGTSVTESSFSRADILTLVEHEAMRRSLGALSRPCGDEKIASSFSPRTVNSFRNGFVDLPLRTNRHNTKNLLLFINGIHNAVSPNSIFP
jgi:hypothetical protein